MVIKMTTTQISRKDFALNITMAMEFLNNGKHTFVDDHNGDTEVLKGYIVLEDNHICPVFDDTRYFCLNPLYISEDDNLIHLSRGSVGGTVMVMNYDSLEEAILAYKKEADECEFMDKVTAYKVF
jgi:hypothetical protein